MSLALRVACQPHLDNTGLSDYHIEVTKSAHYGIQLRIVSTCGKPLVTINGFTLSRIAPTKEEVALAVDLFAQYLDHNHKKFSTLIKALTMSVTNFDVKKHPELSNAYSENIGIEFEKYSVLYDSNKKFIKKITMEEHSNAKASKEFFIGLSKAVNAIDFKPAQAYAKYLKSVKKRTKLIEKATEELQSCSI